MKSTNTIKIVQIDNSELIIRTTKKVYFQIKEALFLEFNTNKLLKKLFCLFKLILLGIIQIILVKNHINKESLFNYRNYRISNINQVQLRKYIDFMGKDIDDKIPTNYINYDKPKVSVIISIYNRQEFVNYTIKSIQKQSLKEIEIIYVDDCSTDKSRDYIEKAAVNDKRIILIKNKKNMGSLYTKSIGVLKSKGKFVHLLDSDNILCDGNYLEYLYNKIINQTKYKFISCDSLLINHFSKRVLIYRPNYSVLWCKLILADYYKNIINKIKDILYMNVNLYDDNLIVYYLYQTSYLNIKKVGVCNIIHKGFHVFYFNGEKENRIKQCRNAKITINAFLKVKNKGVNEEAHRINMDYFIKRDAKCKDIII